MISQDFTNSDRAHLVRFVRSFVRNLDTAEDIAHDALVRAQKYRSDHVSDFTPWLYQIAKRLCVNHYHQQQSHSSCSGIEFVHDPRTDGNPERCAMHEQVRRSLDSLHIEDRIAVAEKFYEGLSLEEMAARHKSPISTQKSRLYRALEKLRKRLVN